MCPDDCSIAGCDGAPLAEVVDFSAHFLFQDGESTLIGFEQLVSFQRKYHTQGLQVSNAVQTSGYDLSDEMTASFARESFLMAISLNGTDETYDILCPTAKEQATSCAVCKTLRRLHKAGANVNVLCVHTEVARHLQAVCSSLTPYGFLQFIPCLNGLDGETLFPELQGSSRFSRSHVGCYDQAYQEGRLVLM